MDQGAGSLIFFIPIVLVVLWMIWLQRKRTRDMAAVQSGLQVGDEVCMTCGVFGRLTALDDTVATIETAPGQRLRFDRRALARKVETGTAATAGRPVGETGATSTGSTESAS